MAAIDPNIALGVKPIQIENPMNQYAALSQIQGNQQAQQLNALKMRQAQQEFDTSNALANAYKGAITPEGNVNYNALIPQLASSGAGSAIPGVLKTKKETEQAAAMLEKTQIEAKQKKLEVQREQFANLSFNPSDENVKAHLQDSVLKGELPQQQADQLWAKVSSLNPAQRSQYFTEMGMKAHELGTYKETARHNAKTENISAGQLGVSQARLGLEQQNQQLLYGKDVVANTVTAADGTVTQFNRFGEVIGKPGAVGKPSATFEKTTELRKQQSRDLGLAITELEKATKDGGLIDKSTGSGVGRLADVAAGFVGQSTPGAIAIAKLKPIADIALKMVPRFEGPQSDKDTASYKEAAGQLADPSLPTQIRKEAGREVLRLMKARKGQFVNEVMANEGIGAAGVDSNNPLLK
jgi:hypothetical protein